MTVWIRSTDDETPDRAYGLWYLRSPVVHVAEEAHRSVPTNRLASIVSPAPLAFCGANLRRASRYSGALGKLHFGTTWRLCPKCEPELSAAKLCVDEGGFLAPLPPTTT